jgi:hypothetical protein
VGHKTALESSKLFLQLQTVREQSLDFVNIGPQVNHFFLSQEFNICIIKPEIFILDHRLFSGDEHYEFADESFFVATFSIKKQSFEIKRADLPLICIIAKAKLITSLLNAHYLLDCPHLELLIVVFTKEA